MDEVVQNQPLLEATFGLFLEPSDAVAKAKAAGWYQTIHGSEYRETLETVFFSWLLLRFRDKTKEVFMWVQDFLETPIEETAFYKEVAEKVGARGIVIGNLMGQIRLLQELKGLVIEDEDSLCLLPVEVLQEKLAQLKHPPNS